MTLRSLRAPSVADQLIHTRSRFSHREELGRGFGTRSATGLVRDARLVSPFLNINSCVGVCSPAVGAMIIHSGNDVQMGLFPQATVTITEQARDDGEPSFQHFSAAAQELLLALSCSKFYSLRVFSRRQVLVYNSGMLCGPSYVEAVAEIERCGLITKINEIYQVPEHKRDMLRNICPLASR